MDAGDLCASISNPSMSKKLQGGGEPAEGAERRENSSPEQFTLPDGKPVDSRGSYVERSSSEAEEQGGPAPDPAAYEVQRGGSTLQNRFIIDIPRIPNKDDYEHLPGHSTVACVLSQNEKDKYFVKLASGETELVCLF